MTRSRRRARLASLAGGFVALAFVTGTVLSADPSATPRGNSGGGAAANAEKPGNGPKAEKPGRGPKAEKKPSTPVTMSGRVEAVEDAKGRTTYQLLANGSTYELSAGPKWWWLDDNPLAAHVGNDVEVSGEQTEGSSEIDVTAVNGTAIRAEGKPPWAGGPKVVGEKHPGWKASRAERAGGKGLGLGRENAPGQLKKAARAEASQTP
jgi:hypothetical protein